MSFSPQTPPCYNLQGPYNNGKLLPAIFRSYPNYGMKGWTQGGVVRREVNPHYHLVWPKDKDRGKLGRFKDILQGKGPDIHLSISAQKNDYMWNRPVKEWWSGWRLNRSGSLYGWKGQKYLKGPPWVGKQSRFYDFCTRRYEDWHPDMWTDAIWQGPRKNSNWPHQIRDVYGVWHEDDSWDAGAPGQKMKNC
ncbi:uncharacterized protein CC84DRAFT_562426 [Paraphaeosphaeria sporulosa]|uniref:Uncharacterized protein n=1 Tax=Paraphaeosphaeria sporulosa TaxID=1460663 RepID=A0A177CMU3_9PLEO|nr:uncharacterized protein CC84DRAFT_562426 [Paraphaeosphaeria sporulosa]OAG08208.1 hypothetical protein CC84DRAFT_562426 [Paraphaeosphaeria sporulosa]